MVNTPPERKQKDKKQKGQGNLIIYKTTKHPNTVANLPAEIAHLLEEIQAKDRVVQECRNVIATRDGSIQKFLKLNGAGQPNPKEEGYCKMVMANFDKARIVQEEKVGLSEKAALLVTSSSSARAPPQDRPAEKKTTSSN